MREAMDDLTEAHRRQLRLMTLLSLCLATLNAAMVVGTAGAAIWLWSDGRIAVGTVAMALPLTWHIASIAGWVALNITTIFENIGVVQEGMRSIAVPRLMTDRPDATPLRVERGAVHFEGVRFGYGTAKGVLHGVDLAVATGERVGLIGPSGAGKSTLVNLLLRFYDLEGGRILIDGQDIAQVTQESLRAHIAMVTQDTSLLHRSIRDNIRYARPQASDWEVRRAAAQAQALDFIEGLEDWYGRRGFDAHVGERGVKLSGGQRQRIALARVILKDAPILVLGRGHLLARFGGRGGDPGTARKPDAGAHGHRHRPPAVDDRTPRPARRARPGQHRRRGNPCPASRPPAAPTPGSGAGNRAVSSIQLRPPASTPLPNSLFRERPAPRQSAVLLFLLFFATNYQQIFRPYSRLPFLRRQRTRANMQLWQF